MRRFVSWRAGLVASAATLALSAFVSAAPSVSAAPAQAHPATLSGGVQPACGAPTQPRQETCWALGPSAKLAGDRISTVAAQNPLSATQLQNAYNLVSAAAEASTDGELVAVVDAFDDPTAQSDLASYRAMEGLPVCDTSTEAGCLTIVNQNGQSSPLPGVDTGATGGATGGWELEESLDIDMVTAICPGCHVLLVEANSANASDLFTAENAAVSAGAKFVSNSWGGSEFPGEYQADNAFLNHPGVAITFAAGDVGYDGDLAAELGVPPLGADYPASSQYVTAVGGTTLTMDGNTRVSETVWSGSGSGCSEAAAKPSWQVDTSASSGCLNRTGNDVAAVGDPATPVAVFDSYPFNGTVFGSTSAAGTSASAAIIAAVYALAGTPKAGTYPAQYPYQHTSAFNAITSGSNGTCESSRQYLCSGTDYTGTTYNAPSGWGTPNGIDGFASTATDDVVTVPDPGTQDYEVGSAVNVPVPAVDSASGQTLTYSANGLPTGLTISASTGTISGNLPPAAGTSIVTVTATDSTGAKGSVTFNIVSVPDLLGGFIGTTGPVRLDLGGKCLDDTVDSIANGKKIQIWRCNGKSSQNWEYVPDGSPGGAGTLQINGKCADITGRGTANGSKIQLWSCTGGANQQWFLVGSAGELYNPASGRCLDDSGKSTTNGTQVEIFTCSGGTNQAWTSPASPAQAGVTGKCLDDNGTRSANGNKIDSYSCNGTGAQDFTIGLDNSLRVFGKCLDVTGRSQLDGAPLQLWSCTTGLRHANQQWIVWAFPVAGAHGAFGEILNVNSNKCLAVPGDSSDNGLQLVQEDCYGNPGEIWALS